MKKILSICTVIMMLLTMLPVNVFACDNTAPTYDELIALACEVFPEYAPAITGNNTSTCTNSRSINQDEVVYRETRQLSSNESLGISLLASGNAIVIYGNTDWISYTASTTDINSIGVAGTATFTVATQGRSFVLSDVSFTIYDYADDYFTNYGTPQPSEFISVTNEYNRSTWIRYRIKVSSNQSVHFDLYFSNNQLVASV